MVIKAPIQEKHRNKQILVSFMIQVWALGTINSFGIYQAHLLATQTEPLALPIGKAEISAIGSTAAGVFVLFAGVAGLLSDSQLGYNATCALGGILQGIGLVCAGFSVKAY